MVSKKWKIRTLQGASLPVASIRIDWRMITALIRRQKKQKQGQWSVEHGNPTETTEHREGTENREDWFADVS
jgi:hypothetical protein